MEESVKIYNDDCIKRLDLLKANSIDVIITDPPYELGFMGKSWDKAGVSFDTKTWEKCLRVLKPGGYLLAFGGSRTFHRIACAIEDAGFEIRDTICWLYGCYSADTQVLTDKGWKYFYNLNGAEQILQWDKTTNQLSWVKPKNYFEYNIDDDLLLFENRHISQLVTKNHKVAVSVKRRRREFEPYELVEAQDIQKSWQLNFPLAGELAGEIDEPDAYLVGWWLTDAWVHTNGKAVMFSQSKPQTLAKLKSYLDAHQIKYSEYVKKAKKNTHRDEHIFYVAGEKAQELLMKYPNRKLTWEMLNWGAKSRQALLDGLIDGDGSRKEGQYAWTFWSQEQERLDIFQALCVSLNYRAFLNKKGGVEFNVKKNSTQIQARHRKQPISYKGKVYCLETETGAFVVRREGKAFISGNSGFPKSMNIGLAVDKKNGIEVKSSYVPNGKNGVYGKGMGGGKTDATLKAKNKWSGWGSCLKPSFEPIIVARKPFKGTLVDNVLEYGVGGLNIDECRIGNETRTYKGCSGTSTTMIGGAFEKGTNKDIEFTATGRFPANTILTYDETDFDEVCGGFPNTKCGMAIRHNSGGNTFGGNNKKPQMEDLGYNDSGSAARYFYCAKASKKDRDEGLEDFGIQTNTHTTVKPTSLMRYLVRLVAPKGATILDPFMGSGSTGKAVMFENRDRNADYKFIGIEKDPSYCEIAEARIKWAKEN